MNRPCSGSRSPTISTRAVRSLSLAVSLAGPLVAGLLISIVSPDAYAQVTEGSYKASALREEVKLDSWPKECGIAPASSSQGGGETAELSLSGDELKITGGGRSYTTSACYDQLPTLTRETHSKDVAKGQWRTRCTTPAGDARHATVETSVAVSGDRVDLTEVGKYESAINGAKCSATLTRKKTFDRIKAAAPQPTVEEPKPEPRCASPGEPSRLEVRPAKKALRVGESFPFRGVVVDAKGCAVYASPTYKIGDVADGVLISVDGAKVTVAEGSHEGSAKLIVTAAGREVSVAIEVTSAEHYDALLAREGLDQSGEENRAAVSTNAVVGGEIHVEGDGRRRRNLFLGITLGASVALIAAWAFLRRRKPQAPLDSESLSARSPGVAPSLNVETGRRSEDMVCPTCRTVAPAGATFCPKDGTKYIPQSSAELVAATSVCPVCQRSFGPGVKVCPEHNEELVPKGAQSVLAPKAEPKPKQERVCPKCGRKFTGNITFCGHDGSPLVSVN